MGRKPGLRKILKIFSKRVDRLKISVIISFVVAGLAHLVERHLAKVEVASSSLVARSTNALAFAGAFLFLPRRQNSLPTHLCAAKLRARSHLYFAAAFARSKVCPRNSDFSDGFP